MRSLSVLRTLTVGRLPTGIVRDSRTQKFFVANSDGGSISVLDASASSVVETITLNDQPQYLAASTAAGRVYAAMWNGTVRAIDPAATTVVSTTSLAGSVTPIGIALNEKTGRMYTANFDSDSVSVVDTSGKLLSTIPVGDAPREVAVDANSGRVFVSHFSTGKLSVIDASSDTVLGTLTVGIQPRTVAVDSARGFAYIVDTTANFVAVIDSLGTKVIRTIAMGDRVSSVAVDPSTGRLYVASSKLYVVDPTTGAILSRTELGGQNVRGMVITDTLVLLTYGVSAGRVAVVSK